ncbi:3,4-dihydroxy-2-butanone-4-phosphate synthase RIB3 [Sporobolomyces salmoneus]|uniref:3,4-dihydroxy-2-butanone-4-phosphate synthase RIB3 n=1 Tax=Sporobolomyces salmoneus TaxID=183962 RepID=UPI00316F25DC
MAAIATSGVAFAAAPLSASSASSSKSKDANSSSLRSDGSLLLDPIESAISAIANGEFVVVVDDLDRENEGDLICSAEKITQQMMAWLIRHSSGYVCICLEKERLESLDLRMMVDQNQDLHKTAYTITCDYAHGTTTGISAHDRALTARKLADQSTTAKDFNRPGHLVPLRANPGGVLKRRGHTEASVDLCKLAGLPPAGIICELVKPDDPDGEMARRDDCAAFARQHGLKMISIEQIEQYRRKQEQQ